MTKDQKPQILFRCFAYRCDAARMQDTKVKLAVTLYLRIIVLTLLISAFSSSSPFLSLPYKLEEAGASTSAESNIMIQNNINFTTSEISILYPVNWNTVKGTFQSEDMNSIITFRSPTQNDTDSSPAAILNIARYDLGPVINTTIEQTIDRYANLQLFSLKATIPDFQVIQFNKITLADRPAYQIVYNGLHGTEEITTMKLLVIDQSSFGSTAYTITYSANSENYPIYLESAIDMISSFIIREKVARAPAEAFLALEFLKYIPEPSREKLQEVASLPILRSVLGGDLTRFIDFIKGSTNMPPSNFARLPTNSDDPVAIHYHLSSAHVNATNDSIYAILVLIFTDNNNPNRVLVEPIDYKVRINGTNFNFTEGGSTSTGLDIKILNGTSFEEALKNTQEYELEVDVLNMERILSSSSKQISESPITIASLSSVR
jgi:hypothetical protein